MRVGATPRAGSCGCTCAVLGTRRRASSPPRNRPGRMCLYQRRPQEVDEMQIPVTNAFIWSVMAISIVVLFFVLRALGRIGVYWVFNWFTLMPSSAILIFAAWYWARGADEVLVRT